MPRGEAAPRPRPGPGAPGWGQRPGPGAHRAPRRGSPARPRGACSPQRRLTAPATGTGGSSPSSCPRGGAPLPPPLTSSHRSRGLALLRHARSPPPAPGTGGFAVPAGCRYPAMPSNKSVSDAPIVQFSNCRILRDHQLQR